jgi:iron complex transport system substrate-binding protein
MSSRALFRRSRAVAAVAAATALTLGVAACSDDDDDSDTGTSASASADGSDSDSDSDDAEQGTWPRTVDSLVIENGQPTGDTEEVEIPAQAGEDRLHLGDPDRLPARRGCPGRRLRRRQGRP